MADDPSLWKVLIVDDDEDNLSVLKQLLDFLGAESYSAHEGLEALKILSERSVTVVLLDLSMPTLDGWEMIKQLRAIEKNVNLPVIAVTAHAMSGDKNRVLASGFNGYISKPFMFSDMIVEIKRCLAAAKIEKVPE